MIKLQVMYNLGKSVSYKNNNNKANLLNVTYGKYPKPCEKNMTRNVNNNTVGNTHQSAIEMQVKSKS